MNNRTLFSVRCAAWLLALSLPSGVAVAQVLYGSLTGNVIDPSSAAVPNAKVEALNVGTGAARETNTDMTGAYTFNNPQSGTYKLTVTAKAFKIVVADHLRIDANQAGVSI